MCLEKTNICALFIQFENEDETLMIDEGQSLEEIYFQKTIIEYHRSSYVEAQLELQDSQDKSFDYVVGKLGNLVLSVSGAERLKFPRQDENYDGKFWIPDLIIDGSNESIYMSHYYSSSLREENGTFYKMEACTVVLENKVIIPIEFFLEESDVIVYKDILADCDTTLGGALEIFSKAHGFEIGTSYTYMNRINNDLEDFHIPDHILKMEIGEALIQDDMLESNASDFFRLSPYGIDELIVLQDS